MCGIVGYLGDENPKDIILDGLKRLEYRGYDSAGVSILDRGQFKRIRASGKLSVLAEKLANESFDGHLGVGHTRWATHGKPSEINAHPHCVDGVSLVHNGIIENFTEIREELLASGAKIDSETDSELVAHLLAREIAVSGDLYLAVKAILPKLRGAFAILAVSQKDPEHMVAFKNGPPLLIGVGKEEIIVASDIQAVVKRTQNVIYLDDNEIASIRPNQLRIFTPAGKEIRKTQIHVDWTEEQQEKRGYKHFMLKEIYDQPLAVARAIEKHVDVESSSVRLSGVGFNAESVHHLAHLNSVEDSAHTLRVLGSIERLFIVACGTSYYAGQIGKYFVERLAGVPVETDVASEFRYRDPVIPAKSMVVVISQSGETADTLAALRLAQQKGAQTLSICNVKLSSIDREAQGHLYMNAGVEVGVASTKAFVSTLALLQLLALSIAKAKEHLSVVDEKNYVRALLAAPSQMELVLAYDKYFAEAASILKSYRGFLYLGRGVSFPIAMEGALKMKELAYMHAEGYAAGEMKHGPLALIDPGMMIVSVIPHDDLFEKTLSNLEEARARGGAIIALGTGENPKLRELCQHYLAIPQAMWTINPLLTVIPMQLLAYHVADALGHDVDQPRNLAKSVTVE